MEFIYHFNKTLKRKINLSIVVIFVLVVIAFWSVMMVSSFLKRDRMTAYDFPGSVWESKEPFIRLEVSETSGEGINGIIQLEDQEIEVHLQTTAGQNATLYDRKMFDRALKGDEHSNMVLLEVICRYSEDTIGFKIYKDNIYDYKYHEIILTRVK